MDITGEFGGGGGGSAHTPVESDDTLQSKQIVKLLFAVSEGEIEAVDDILLNEVTIANYTAVWDWRSGTANQTVIPGFTDTEEPIASFAPVNVLAATDYFVSVPYDAAACRMTLTLSALKQINADNDQIAYGVDFDVYTRPTTAGLWTFIETVRKNGKASSPYSWDVRVPRPSGVTIASSWEIKLVRSTPDDADSKHVSPSSWDSAIAIRESDLAYPNTALVGITLTDAQQFGGRIPEVKFKLKGIKVKIPTNYDPVTHIYTETPPWDGSLTETLFHHTPNIAWHIYNVLNNSRYGLNIVKADIDVISLYNLSKYADELVDDGKGGQERRYELHNQFYTRETAPAFLTFLLNICNANFTTNEFGQISIMFDRPNQAITKQVTNANVIDGAFNYSSSELESRYNLVNVTYNREEFNGRTDTATETEPSLVSRYGLQSSDIVLPGCTSEAQAIRKARWAIYTNSFLPNVISYKLAFAGLTYHVGELVKIFDSDNQGSNQAGLIQSFSDNGINTTLVLDRSVTLLAENYTVSFLGADGITEEVHTLLETNTTTTTVSFVGIVAVAVNSVFILAGLIVPKTYKVVKVAKDEQQYNISCIEHDEAKYAYIDQAVVLAAPSGDFVNISEFSTLPVTSITIIENFSSNGVTQNSVLQVTWLWTKGTASYTPNFKLTWKRDNQQSHLVDDIFGNTFDIIDPVPGVYEVTVWAVNPFTGITSTPVVQTYDFRTVATTSSLQPPNNIFINGTAGLVFDSPDVNLTFAYDIANDNVSDSLKDYVIEVWDSTTTNLKGTYVVTPGANKGGLFTFLYSENITQFGTATRTFNIKLFSRDVIGDLSNPAIVQVTNNVPGLASFTLASGTEATYISITPPGDLDLAGFIVYRSESNGFIPGPSDIIYKGLDTYISLNGVAGTQYFYKIAVFDTFGETGLLISGEQSSTLLSSQVDTWIFEGLIFKPNDPATNMVSWTAGTASKNGAAPVSIAAGNASWTSGTIYLYYAGTGGNLSATGNIATAVTGVQVLANYHGGTDLIVGNGDAFTDGGLILANTVGANQLVTNNAIITSTAQIQNLIVQNQHVADGAITNLKIGDIIQSANFSVALTQGWQFDKLGNFLSYGDVELRDGNGNLILTTGANALVQWSGVGGTGIPADNATVGADSSNLAVGMGVNLTPNSNFFSASLSGWQPVNITITSVLGVNLSFDWFPVGGNAAYLHQLDGTSVGYSEIRSSHIPVVPGRNYEFYALTGAHRCNVLVFVSWFDAGGAYVSNTSLPSNNEEKLGGNNLSAYKQVGGFGVAPASAATGRLALRKNATKAGLGYTDSYMFVTNTYLGEALPNQTEFSAWTPGPAVGSLSNMDSVDYSANVTGVKPPSDADNTASNTAAAIAGQGSFATLNQLNSTNIGTYMSLAAIGAAQIGSVALVGANNFSVKTSTAGERIEMDGQVIKVFDASGVLRVKLGNLLA